MFTSKSLKQFAYSRKKPVYPRGLEEAAEAHRRRAIGVECTGRRSVIHGAPGKDVQPTRIFLWFVFRNSFLGFSSFLSFG